jgi:hypothetical protein
MSVRLVVTKQELPMLKLYNPFTTTSGPWLARDGMHYAQKEYLEEMTEQYPKQYRLDLEFMLGNFIVHLVN